MDGSESRAPCGLVSEGFWVEVKAEGCERDGRNWG